MKKGNIAVPSNAAKPEERKRAIRKPATPEDTAGKKGSKSLHRNGDIPGLKNHSPVQKQDIVSIDDLDE